jgi:hypothetical protein
VSELKARLGEANERARAATAAKEAAESAKEAAEAATEAALHPKGDEAGAREHDAARVRDCGVQHSAETADAEMQTADETGARECDEKAKHSASVEAHPARPPAAVLVRIGVCGGCDRCSSRARRRQLLQAWQVWRAYQQAEAAYLDVASMHFDHVVLTTGGGDESASRRLEPLWRCARRDKRDWALLHACQQGSTSAAEALLSRGAQVGVCNGLGQNALHAACFEGHIDVVYALLEAGSDDLEAEDTNGHTALVLASLRGHVDVVRVLQEAEQALVVAGDLGGRTAASYVRERG